MRFTIWLFGHEVLSVETGGLDEEHGPATGQPFGFAGGSVVQAELAGPVEGTDSCEINVQRK